MSEFIVPHIELPKGPLTHAGIMGGTKSSMLEGVLGSTERPWRLGADKFIRGISLPAKRSYRDMIRYFASFGGTYAAKILDHVFNDGTLAAPAPYLALGTGAIGDADIGATFGSTTEANYTGYLRVLIGAADMSAGAAAAPATKTNTAVLTFPACTASSAVVIAWCTVNGTATTRLNAGDVILYGTCTSTTVDTTHTPPTVAAAGLNATLE